MSMNSMTFNVLLMKELIKSPFAKSITFSANDGSNSGSTKDIMISWVYSLFLKAKAATTKESDPNLWKAMHFPFVD